MRKTIGVTLTAATLMFGGAAVANATVPSEQVPSSVTTTQADTTYANNDQDSDKTGLWGLAGLLGLFGLAGLKRRNDTPVAQTHAAAVPPRT